MSPDREAAEVPSEAQQHPAVLLVDDLPEKLLVLQTVLEGLPCELVHANSGQEALRQVLKRRFAVVLLDVNMPDIDGFETAAMMRQYGPSAQTPIIFVTAYVDEMQTAQGYSLGAVDYIVTPIVPQVLRSKVKVFLDLDASGRREKALAAAQAGRRAAEAVSRRLSFVAHASRLIGGSLAQTDPVAPLLAHLREAFVGEAVVVRADDAGAIASLRPEHRGPLEAVLAGAGRVDLGGGCVLPLRYARQTLGALLVTGTGPDEAWQALDEVAERLSAALENARLYRALQTEIEVRRAAERELKEANRRKDEFLAMLSHELRNPLAPIGGSAEVVRRLSAGNHKLERSADIISRQVDHMRRLIDELLDVARISQGKIVLDQQSLDLRAVVAQAVETVRPLIDKHRHELVLAQPDYGVWMRGDGARLTQVVSNLLTNAAKYTPDGGRIEVTLTIRDGEACLSVQDNGLGIDAALLPRVFDLFEQGERGLDRSQGGLGVGLTLAQRLVTLHQGSIVATSDGPGLGATFTVKLPCLSEVSGSVPTAGAPSAQPAAPARRVLVVDDNVDAAVSMATLLELGGHRVWLSHDGRAALAEAAACAPDAVVLDLGLPGMDGFEVARRLRASTPGRPPLLIAVTGYGDPRDRQRVKDAGFDLHLVKPANPADVLRAIEGDVGDRAAAALRTVPADSAAAERGR